MKTFLFSFLSIAIIALFFLSCQKEVSFEEDQAPGGSNTASFTLQGAPGVCMNDSIAGSYFKGSALDAGNHVLISVNVTIPGTYIISTDEVNGYSFSSSGTFTATGIQTVDLAASGLPVNAGTDIFTVNADSSSCTFSIVVLTAATATNNDLFPLTMSSYWDYDDLYYKGSTAKHVIVDTVRREGNLYPVMEEQISPNGPRLYFYRKSGPDYFEYIPVDKYTHSFQYNKRIYDDLLFLNENLNTGVVWQSHEFSDTTTLGQVMGLQYKYVCLEADVPEVINGYVFTHVYKIQMKPQIRSVGNLYTDTGEVYTYYYARGIGLIYYKETNLGFSSGELQIRGWQVN